MKHLFFIVMQLFAGIIYVDAQRVCNTVEASSDFYQVLPSTLSAGALSRDTLPGEFIIIPVVVHVLYHEANQNISTAQVLSQMEALNKDFNRANTDAINTPAFFANLAADVRIKFCLARVDAQGRATNGIIRRHTNITNFLANDEMKFSAAGGDNAWDSKRYLNIWVCKLFGRSLGYATYPGGPADRDGIVIAFDAFGTTGTSAAPFDKGRTTTHETGHWLGLKHLWGDANCGNDGIADTPPQKAYNSGCPLFPQTSSCSSNQWGDLFMNFMDFTDDACMNLFTHGQKSKMRSLFANAGARNTFLLSNACDSSQVEDGPLPVVINSSATFISVYPNPSAGDLYLEIKQTEPVVNSNYTIFNSIGLVMIKGKLNKNKSLINLNQFPAGIYFVKVGDGKDAITKKVLKQ